MTIAVSLSLSPYDRKLPMFCIFYSNVLALPIIKNNFLLFCCTCHHSTHHFYALHRRLSWLLPCAQSPLCDYRFFVDAMEHNKTAALDREMRQHGDMGALILTFPFSCCLFNVPDSINLSRCFES
jgi:hypothetical protein